MLTQSEVKEERKQRKHLQDLSVAVGTFLRAMDVLVKRPSDEKRGRDIALLLNTLEMANDQVRFFALGVDYRDDAQKNKKPMTDAQVDSLLEKLRKVA